MATPENLLDAFSMAGVENWSLRSIRRHHMDRMKERMRQMVRRWPGGGLKLSADPEQIGRLAANHGTHECVMCHFEKRFRKRRA